MPQHPGDSVHGLIGINDPGASGGVHVGVNVHDHIRAFGLLAAAAALAGAGEIVLQAIHGITIQIMRGSVNRAFPGQGSNLLIIAVMAGAAIYAGLSGIQGRNRGVDGFQRKAVHGGRARRFHQRPSAGRFRRFGQGNICNGQILRVGQGSFLRQHIGKANLRPFHRPVREVVPVKKRHLIPHAARAVHPDGIHLHNGVFHEHAHILVAVGVIPQRIIHIRKYPGFGADEKEGADSHFGLIRLGFFFRLIGWSIRRFGFFRLLIGKNGIVDFFLARSFRVFRICHRRFHNSFLRRFRQDDGSHEHGKIPRRGGKIRGRQHVHPGGGIRVLHDFLLQIRFPNIAGNGFIGVVQEPDQDAAVVPPFRVLKGQQDHAFFDDGADHFAVLQGAGFIHLRGGAFGGDIGMTGLLNGVFDITAVIKLGDFFFQGQRLDGILACLFF